MAVSIFVRVSSRRPVSLSECGIFHQDSIGRALAAWVGWNRNSRRCVIAGRSASRRPERPENGLLVPTPGIDLLGGAPVLLPSSSPGPSFRRRQRWPLRGEIPPIRLRSIDGLLISRTSAVKRSDVQIPNSGTRFGGSGPVAPIWAARDVARWRPANGSTRQRGWRGWRDRRVNYPLHDIDEDEGRRKCELPASKQHHYGPPLLYAYSSPIGILS